MRYNGYSLNDRNNKIILRTFFSTVTPGKRTYREDQQGKCELSTVILGNGIYTANKKDYHFQPGDVFLFGSDEIHCLTDISGKFVLANIQFSPRILWSDSDTFSALRIFWGRNENFENMIDSKNPCTQDIHNKIKTISDELRDKKDGYPFIAKYMLFSALISIVRNYDYLDKSYSGEKFKNTVKPMTHALNYIDDNLERSITLEDIAKTAAMTPTYFSTLFKKMNGISPWEYITIKRVEKAVELLKTTNLTKLDIAMRCGFSSSSNFYKAFTKVTGKKPSQYTHT